MWGARIVLKLRVRCACVEGEGNNAMEVGRARRGLCELDCAGSVTGATHTAHARGDGAGKRELGWVWAAIVIAER